MRAAPSPRLHVFVCANRREGSPLGPGCGDRGDALYEALKSEVMAQRKVADIWVTKTHCLGICPKRGATVARYPSAEPIVSDVEVADVAALLSLPSPSPVTAASGHAPPASEPEAREAPEAPEARERDWNHDWDAIEKELVAIEELQTAKVLDLARRLKPGLTLEDVQNPHDFPELDDADWHYADGILTGMKSVTSALRALRRRREPTQDQ